MEDDSSSTGSGRRSTQRLCFRGGGGGHHSRLLMILLCFLVYKFQYEKKSVSYVQQEIQNTHSRVHAEENGEEGGEDTNTTTTIKKGQPPKQYFMYVLTLQGVKGADSSNDHRMDDFIRHWKILCGNATTSTIQFRKCPGRIISHPDVPNGYGLSLAYIDCIDQAMAEKDDNENEPFMFLEDDARLYNSNFCHATYRKRLYDSLPFNDTTILMLGGHDMSFYNDDDNDKYNQYSSSSSIQQQQEQQQDALPFLARPKFGAGSYGFVVMGGVEQLQYLRRKLIQMTMNRTFTTRGMASFKAIDRQFYIYPKMKTYATIPWIVYHEGGLYSNTKGMVRGEFGAGSQQYRWIPGLTGSFQNCSSSSTTNNNHMTTTKKTTILPNKHATTTTTATNPTIQDGTVIVSCRTVYYRISSQSRLLLLSNQNNNNDDDDDILMVVVGVFSKNRSFPKRQAIRDSWGRRSSSSGSGHDNNATTSASVIILFVVNGDWDNEIQNEFEQYSDMLWLDIPDNVFTDTLKTGALLQLVAEEATTTTNENMHTPAVLKTMDDRSVDLTNLLLDDSMQQYIHKSTSTTSTTSSNASASTTTVQLWGTRCGTGVRPNHIGLRVENDKQEESKDDDAAPRRSGGGGDGDEVDDYFLPEYCRGSSYLIYFGSCAAREIPYTRLVSHDDAYVGMLGERCGLKDSANFQSTLKRWVTKNEAET